MYRQELSQISELTSEMQNSRGAVTRSAKRRYPPSKTLSSTSIAAPLPTKTGSPVSVNVAFSVPHMCVHTHGGAKTKGNGPTDRHCCGNARVKRRQQPHWALARALRGLLHILLARHEVAEELEVAAAPFFLRVLVIGGLLLDDVGDLLVEVRRALLVEIDVRRVCGGDNGRYGREKVGTLSPEQLEELVLEVLTEADDMVGIICPNDKDPFIALKRHEPVSGIGKHQYGAVKLTMNAPHCSLSARGSQLMVSKIWIRVLLSMYRQSSSGPLWE